MNLDDVTAAWRSEDLSPLFGVDKALLHQALRHEQAKRDTQTRRMMWVGYAGGAVLLVVSGLFLAIMFEPQYDDVRVVWDYVGFGIACAVVSRSSTTRRPLSAAWG